MMKSILFASLSILALLFAMASCQSMRSIDNVWQNEENRKEQRRDEKWDDLKKQVSLVLSRTDDMQEFKMVRADI
jgi:hypothetical protein